MVQGYCYAAPNEALAADRNQRASHRQLAARCSCRPAAEARRSMASLAIGKPTSDMDFDFPTLIGELSDEERVRFYEILAHNLTVSIRGIWSDEHLTDGEKVERLKWVNEIMHRVVMKAALLRVQKNQFSESDSWEGIKHWVSLSPEISAPVEWALKTSYESCRR